MTMVNLDDFTDMMREVYVFVRDHPDTTIAETAEALYPAHAEEMRRSVDPYQCFRVRVQKRLYQLAKMGFVVREKDNGRTSRFRTVE